MRKISALLVLILLLASSLAPLASAQSGIIITCDDVQILGSGEIVFDVTNTRSSKIQASISSVFYSLEEQGFKVNSMHEWKELPYTVSVPDLGTRLIEVYDNTTGQTTTAEETYIVGYHDETHYRWDWKPTKMFLIDGKSTQPKSDLITIGPGETKTFKFDVTKKAELNGEPIKFDIVVEGDGFREVLDPWVLGDWNRRAPLQINNSGCATALEHFPVYMNLTYDSDMNSNFSDIRIVNDTAGAEVPLWNMTVVDGQYALIRFNVTYLEPSAWTNDTYFIYYNNSEAATVSDISTTFSFSDDIEDGDITDWSQESGTWVAYLSGGNYVLRESSGTGNRGRVIATSSSDLTSYIFEAEVNNEEYLDDQGVGILFHYQDAQNWLLFDFFEVTGGGTNTMRLAGLVANSWVSYDETSAFTPSAGTFYTLKVVVNGTAVKCYVDDVLIYDKASGTLGLSHGEVGAWSHFSKAQLDDFRVYPYADPEPDVVVGAEEERYCVDFSNPQPIDGATNLLLNYTYSTNLNITTYTTLNYNHTNLTFYDYPTNTTIATENFTANGTQITNVSWSNLEYNTTYQWWVNATTNDGDGYDSSIYNFTTILAEFSDEDPADGTDEVLLDTNLSITIYHNETYMNLSFINDDTDEVMGTADNVTGGTIGTTTVELNGAKTYNWYVSAECPNGSTINTSVYTFHTVNAINFYEENDPTTRITANISVVLTTATGTTTTTATNGTLNLTGITFYEEVMLSFTNDGYYGRTVILPEGFGYTGRLYLLNDSVSAVSNQFKIADYTGGSFSTDQTRVILKRWLDGNERYVCGGYRGVSNSVGTITQLGAVYNVYVSNADETRGLGAFYSKDAGDVYLSVGLVTYPDYIETHYDYIAYNITKGTSYYANGSLSDAWINIAINNTRNSTQWVNITISDALDPSTIFYNVNVTDNSSYISLTYHPPLDEVIKGTKFLVTMSHRASPVEDVLEIVDFVLEKFVERLMFFEENPEYMWFASGFIIIFTAMIFSFGYSDVGGFVVATLALVLWKIKWLPDNALSVPILILAFIIAGLNAVFVKGKRGEI